MVILTNICTLDAVVYWAHYRLPSSRTTLNGEQPYPWKLLHLRDVMSRHRIDIITFLFCNFLLCCLPLLGVSDYIFILSLSRGGDRRVVSTGSNLEARCWTLESGRILHSPVSRFPVSSFPVLAFPRYCPRILFKYFCWCGVHRNSRFIFVEYLYSRHPDCR